MNDLYSVYHQTTLDEECREFIVNWHYSRSYRSLKHRHVFTLINNYRNRLEGVAVYGDPMSRHYNESGLIELRRLCLIDDTPRNSESFFIAKTLRYLRNNTDYTGVLSFADPNVGHEGIIYKASNFRYDGQEGGNPRVISHGDRKIHLREMYQKKGGEYTNSALRIQELVNNGEAQVLKQEGKFRYIYEF